MYRSELGEDNGYIICYSISYTSYGQTLLVRMDKNVQRQRLSVAGVESHF